MQAGEETMIQRFYFDHNATTPVRPEVLAAMVPYLTERYGNASSVHWYGQEAKHALELSRDRIAIAIGAEPEEIFFTGCGTESDNIALIGHLRMRLPHKNGLVTSTVEHSAVLKSSAQLEREGYPVTYVGVDGLCKLDLDALKKAVTEKTALVSIIHGNNETGVLQDIEKIAEIAHDHGAIFHTDTVQSAGKVPINVKKIGIDMLSMSAHKLNAPKGIGVLYVRKGVEVSPLTYGGGHERGLRPGTENVAGIVALAKALDIAIQEMDIRAHNLSALRDRLEKGIEETIPGVLFNGRDAPRLPGTSNVLIPGVDGEALLFSLDRAGIAVSTGSACTSGEIKPSHVLLAMGREPKVAQSSLRFSMGWGTTGEGVIKILEVLPPIVERLRAVSSGM
jgi:cysteine desulfurase